MHGSLATDTGWTDFGATHQKFDYPQIPLKPNALPAGAWCTASSPLDP